MKIQNEVNLNFLSKSQNESYARVAVAAFFTHLDPTVGEISEIKTAVSEAVTNCIVHAYPNAVGKIYITARILEGDIAYIKIRDQGCGIADIPQAMEPLFTTAPDEERAGLGFVVMQSFMDAVSVRSTPQKGTCIIMKKKITSRGQGSGKDAHE